LTTFLNRCFLGRVGAKLHPPFFTFNFEALKQSLFIVQVLIVSFLYLSCQKKEPSPGPSPGSMQLVSAKVGQLKLTPEGPNVNAPVDSVIHLQFSNKLNAATIAGSIFLKREDGTAIPVQNSLKQDQQSVEVTPSQPLEYVSTYRLQISDMLKGALGETFPGVTYELTTINGELTITQVTVNGQNFSTPNIPADVDFHKIDVIITFSHPLDPATLSSAFNFSNPIANGFQLTNSNRTVTITTEEPAAYLSRYYFIASSGIKGENGFSFDGFVNSFFTSLDSTPKFPIISDDALLDLIQEQTFRYFYDFAHPISGMARERNTSGDIVTSGGSGFGLMALVVGIHRGYITRAEGIARLDKILLFLETSERHHGAWSHWLNGATGATYPFSTQDNGGDLVETSYLVQGLITIRQYMDPAVGFEQELINRIDALVEGVEYDWYTRDQNALYWHWSPDFGWAMNMRVEGYNEALITHVLAASSETYPVSAEVYHQGWAKNGSIRNGNLYYGIELPVGYAYGGPLFFAHYSFLGLDARTLQDQYADYWEQNMNHSLINHAYCVDNPKNFIGYSNDCWGLTASDNPWGYNAHSPTNDLGVIAPTAAISSLPYTPVQSMAAIRHFYYILGDRLWGPYGFYDAFCPKENWWASSYIAIDQGPIICMIENYRSGLLWNLFMSNPEVKAGLDKLGFTY